MKLHWQKEGIIYSPDGSRNWDYSHASIPTPLQVNTGHLRVFITVRDNKGISRPGFVDIDSQNPKKIIRTSDQPLLDIGQPGTFDENGILLCSVVKVNKQLYMYYSGFELGHKIRYRLLTGLAISDDNGESFYRIKETPVLERSDTELFFRGGAFVRLDNGIFRMWYVAGSKWLQIGKSKSPVYDIRYIESKDGIHWPDKGKIVIKCNQHDEHGLGRPYVTINPDGSYTMYYSIRRTSLGAYRLGMAESPDGLKWTRNDEKINLDVSSQSFDSEAIMYAAPVTINNQTWLFYNGNDFGREGFATAKLIQ